MLIQIRNAYGCMLTQLLRSMLLGHTGYVGVVSSIAANLMDGIPTCQDDKACKGAEAPLLTRSHTHTRITSIVTIRCRRGQTRRSDRRTMMRWAGGRRVTQQREWFCTVCRMGPRPINLTGFTYKICSPQMVGIAI